MKSFPGLLAALSVLGGIAAGQTSSWSAGFHRPGVSNDNVFGGGDIRASVIFDDGSGPTLIVAGDFEYAGGTPSNGLARWDGSTWSDIGVSNYGGSGVRDLAVFDDGTGAAVYAAVPGGVWKWDGTWSYLAVLSGPAGCTAARSLEVFDDGTGPALYVGGRFTSVDGVPVNNLARWDGTSWTNVGGGVIANTLCNVLLFGEDELAPVGDMIVFDDGGGSALYVGGTFHQAGSLAVDLIARWDGSTWTSVGGGMAGSAPDRVKCFALFDDGGGTDLYVGGRFYNAGGDPNADSLARWDGVAWSGLTGAALTTLWIEDLEAYDDGSGPALYVGGWDGMELPAAGTPVFGKWSPGGGYVDLKDGIASNTLSPIVYDLVAFDEHGGTSLLVSGHITYVGSEGLYIGQVARWTGSWSTVGGGWVPEFVRDVEVLYEWDDGSGPALYGAMEGGDPSWILRFDGTCWTRAWSIETSYRGIDSFIEFDDGGGTKLYVCGDFSSIDGVAAVDIAQFDGTTWSPLGTGYPGANRIGAMAVFDDGTGDALYVGGETGFSTSLLWKWDGTSWTELSDPLAGSSVNAMLVHDDGSGTSLFVGGELASTSGIPDVGGILRWDGSGWSELDGGLWENGAHEGIVDSLVAFDDGGGTDLYAGGEFNQGHPSNPTVLHHIGRWNGTSWSNLSGGFSQSSQNSDRVYALAVHDEGSGPRLYAGGYFYENLPPRVPSSIARWSGSFWQAIGGGVEHEPYTRTVFAIASFDDGASASRALYIGGNFHAAGGRSSYKVARWGAPMWEAAAVIRNGGGANPLGFAEVTPAQLGETWGTTVDIATPGALASVVFFAAGGPTQGIVLSGEVNGELLCLPPYVGPADVGFGVHDITLPLDCSLLGATICTQAATYSPGDIALNNAIDITFGGPF